MQVLSLFLELVALTGATVHTQVPGEAPRRATVLLEGDRITAVGADLEIPAGARVIDLAGRHLVPGLIDALVYYDGEHDPLYTAAGVTAVFDCGGRRTENLIHRIDEARAASFGPALYLCGAVLDGDPPSSPNATVLRDERAAELLLPILFDEDVDFLTFHLGLTEPVWKRTIALAHDARVPVYGPLPRGVLLATALAAGQDGLHFLDGLVPAGATWEIVQAPAFTPAIEALARADVLVAPVLIATAARLVDQRDPAQFERLKLLDPSYEDFWKLELARRADLMERTPGAIETGQRVLAKQRELVAALHAAGVTLVPGSAAAQPWLMPGQALHDELALLEASGLSPAEVLRMATRGAAEALGIASRRGSIAPGLIADLVCTDEDPTQDLETLRTPELVVVRGGLLDRAGIEERLKALAQRNGARRAEVDRALTVGEPERPEGALVLSGTVETRVLERKTRVERFNVVRTPEGATAYASRTRFADGVEIALVQEIADGRVRSFVARVLDGEKELVCEGIWAAESMRMQRRASGVALDTRSTRERPVCVDVGDSVTTLMILGQLETTEPFSVLRLHALLEPETANWEMKTAENGDLQVRTNIGGMVCRFGTDGAPTMALSRVGQVQALTRLLSSDAYGGAGLPLPASKRASAVPSPASAPAPGEPGEPRETDEPGGNDEPGQSGAGGRADAGGEDGADG